MIHTHVHVWNLACIALLTVLPMLSSAMSPSTIVHTANRTSSCNTSAGVLQDARAGVAMLLVLS
jgi:predicted small secreted protein